MKKYIFNEKHFKSKYKPIEESIEDISRKASMSPSSMKSKRNGTRNFSDDDYKNIRDKVDPLLIFNAEKIIGKLILRVNLDLTANERFVLYKVLCDYETLWFSVDDFTGRISERVYNKEKIQIIFNDCTVKTDQSGKEEFLYRKRYNEDRQIEEYSLNLTIAIKYTELKDSD